MRNLALAQVLLDAGEADHVVYALARQRVIAQSGTASARSRTRSRRAQQRPSSPCPPNSWQASTPTRDRSSRRSTRRPSSSRRRIERQGAAHAAARSGTQRHGAARSGSERLGAARNGGNLSSRTSRGDSRGGPSYARRHAVRATTYITRCDTTTSRRLPPDHQARLAIFDWIGAFYNRKRRHSAVGYLTPEAYEQRHFTTAA